MIKKRLKNGSALVIIAVGLLIAGIMLSVLIAPDSSILLKQQEKMQYKMDRIKSAVLVYAQTNSGLYPCPARFDLAISSSSFGSSINACLPATNCTGAGINCPASNNKTWIGTVPTRTLGLPDDFAFDSWGNRITYVVNNNGTFPIKNLGGTTIANLKYYVISHGKDGVGAYNGGGTQNACTLSGAGATTSELENCNFSTDDIFIYSPWSSAPSTYYDDITTKLY